MKQVAVRLGPGRLDPAPAGARRPPDRAAEAAAVLAAGGRGAGRVDLRRHARLSGRHRRFGRRPLRERTAGPRSRQPRLAAGRHPHQEGPDARAGSRAEGHPGGLRQDLRLIPQGNARSDRKRQSDAEDHESHADGRRGQAEARPGAGGERPPLCVADGLGHRQPGGGRRRRRPAPDDRNRRRPEAPGRRRHGRQGSGGRFLDQRHPRRAGTHQQPDRQRQDGRDRGCRPQVARPADPPVRRQGRQDLRTERAQDGGPALGPADRRTAGAEVRGGRGRQGHPLLQPVQVGDLSGPVVASDARPGRRRHRPQHHRAGRPGDPGPHHERRRPADRRSRPDRHRALFADPPGSPELRRAVDLVGNPGHGHQGHRPDLPLHQGRQDRPVRRRRRRQDRDHAGTDQQHRQGVRRLFGSGRRGRAHPRRQRPVSRDDRVEREPAGRRRREPLRPGLRPDERAPRRPRPRRPDRPGPGRVLPRRRGQGRPAVHRQHLPLHASRFGNVGSAGPHSLGRGLSADAGHRDGQPAGAHHLDQEGLDHLDPGHLRSRRRPDRPGARRLVRPLGRDHRSVP
uniref:LigA n=1 Tax=Parastrongyloides trichosuri TaxID=131310 RepID=A0A0N4ZGU7_PARTI